MHRCVDALPELAWESDGAVKVKGKEGKGKLTFLLSSCLSPLLLQTPSPTLEVSFPKPSSRSSVEEVQQVLPSPITDVLQGQSSSSSTFSSRAEGGASTPESHLPFLLSYISANSPTRSTPPMPNTARSVPSTNGKPPASKPPAPSVITSFALRPCRASVNRERA